MNKVAEITAAEHTTGHRLFVRFSNGASGEIDLGPRLRFDDVFAPLRDPAEFAKVSVNHELGTVVWPSGADLCPDMLREMLAETAESHAAEAH